MGKGVLHVTVEGCHGIDDDSWINKADPYAIVTLGSQKHQTPPAKGGGKNPVWNAQLEFNVDNEDLLDVRIYDKDTLRSDDFMGSATISLSRAYSSGSSKETAAVKTKEGKDKGTVTVSLKFVGTGGHAATHAAGHIETAGHGGHDDHEGKKHKKKKDKKDKKDKHGSSSSSSSDSD